MNASPSKFRYKCSSCNELHDGLPDVTFARPDACDRLTEEERMERALINEDFCIIDGTRYFLRCIAEAPITGYNEDFGWGLWVEVGWSGFKKIWEAYSYEEAAQELEITGTVQNTLQHYPETLGLACTVKLLDDGQRPHVAVSDEAHILTAHQKDGLTLEEAIRQARTVGALLVVG